LQTELNCLEQGDDQVFLMLVLPGVEEHGHDDRFGFAVRQGLDRCLQACFEDGQDVSQAVRLADAPLAVDRNDKGIAARRVAVKPGIELRRNP